MQHTGAIIFVLSQIFLKIQRFEIGEMEVEHPVPRLHAKFHQNPWCGFGEKCGQDNDIV